MKKNGMTKRTTPTTKAVPEKETEWKETLHPKKEEAVTEDLFSTASDEEDDDGEEETEEAEVEVVVKDAEAEDDGEEAPEFDPETWHPTVANQIIKVPKTFRQAVKAKCKDCCAGSKKNVRCCSAFTCPLYAYRLGKSPFRKKRVVSDEQRAAARERLQEARKLRKPKKEVEE